MNSTQMACLQKVINALQECEGNGLTFSHTSLRLDVEDDESHYLGYLSAQKLFELLDFIDGCGVFKPKSVGGDDEGYVLRCECGCSYLDKGTQDESCGEC